MPEDLSQDGGQQPQGPEGDVPGDPQQGFEPPADGADQSVVGGEEQPSLGSDDETIHLGTVDHGEEGSADQIPQGGEDSAGVPSEGPDHPYTREDDVEKARVMAEAENKFRTKAAENRAILQPSEEELRVKEITHQLRTAHPKSMSAIGRWRLGRERDRLREAYTGPVYRRAEEERTQANEEAAREFVRDFPFDADDPDTSLTKTNPGDRAQWYDERASRIGDWAGALHDHPLSDEFKAEYEGFQFAPRMMVRLEDSVTRGERELERLEEQLLSESIIGGDIHNAVNGLSSNDARRERDEISRMVATAGQEAPELDDQREALRAEGEALAERFDEFRRHLIEEVEIPKVRNSNALTRKFINDVRREVGLPSLSTEGEPTDSDQPNPE